MPGNFAPTSGGLVTHLFNFFQKLKSTAEVRGHSRELLFKVIPKGIVHCVLGLAFQTVQGLNTNYFLCPKTVIRSCLLSPTQTVLAAIKDHYTDRGRPRTACGLQQS